MAQEENDNPRPFDVRTIRHLIRLMSEHDLSEIDLSEGDRRIQLRRGPRVVGTAGGNPATHLVLPGLHGAPASAAAAAGTHGLAPAASSAAGASTQAADAAAAPPGKKLIEIKSPTVGTFYAQKEPGAPPFVTVGSRVTPTTVVCLIEAMKVYNEITADCAGVIQEVCVNNKDFVEFNTVLFRVDPTG